MSKSDYLENKLLDHIFGATVYTPPATLYIALYTSDPGDADAGTEVTGGSYARQAVANTPANWPDATNGQKSNANAIVFPQATASWGTVTHVGIRDALTGGNLLYSGALTTPRTVNNGDTFSFAATQLVIIED